MSNIKEIEAEIDKIAAIMGELRLLSRNTGIDVREALHHLDDALVKLHYAKELSKNDQPPMEYFENGGI